MVNTVDFISRAVSQHTDLLLIRVLLQLHLFQLQIQISLLLLALQVLVFDGCDSRFNELFTALLLKCKAFLHVHQLPLIGGLSLIDSAVEIGGLLPEELEIRLRYLIQQLRVLP